MVKHVLPADATTCKAFDISESLMVGISPTIPPHGDPCFLDNISVQNHGELSSRETCRLLRPTKENLSLPSFKCLTNTTPQIMTRMVSQPNSIDKMNLLPNNLGSHQVNVMQQQQMTSSYQMSDELNTPKIVDSDFEFSFGQMSNLDTPCTSSAEVATAAPELSFDCDWVVDIPPIPINSNNNADTPISEILNCGWTDNQTALKRPKELKLTLQANCIPMSSTPNMNVDTPNMAVDTPDVLQSLEGSEDFNLLSFIVGKSNGKASLLDYPSPLLQVAKTTTIRGQKSATTLKREQRFTEEEQNIPIHEEFPFINPVIKTEPEISHVKTEPEAQFTVVKNEYYSEGSSTIPSPVQELNVTQSSIQELNVTSSSVQRPEKRSSRLISKETRQYVENSESDEDVAPKRPRRNSSVMSNYSYGHSVGKSEYTNDQDDSSIAGSAAESKYKDLREKNNEASRRSRQNRRTKETAMERKASELEAEHRRLKSKHDAIEKCVLQLRQMLLNIIPRANKNA